MSCYIGLDLGGTNIKAGLVDDQGNVLAFRSLPTEAEQGPEHVIERIVRTVHQVAGDKGLTLHQLGGIGIGTPGQCNVREGMVLNAPNMPGWKNIPLRRWIADETGMPTVMDNDANAAAFGEYWAGAGRDQSIRHLVMLTIGTGIGGGVLVDGRLVRGAYDSAMEVGHMVVVPDGQACPCGQNGCLETYASANAIARHAVRRLSVDENSVLQHKHQSGEEITCRDVFDAAAAGDPLALSVVDRAADYLGLTCCTITRMFDPQMIVFAGGVIAAGDLLFDRIRRAFHDRTWRLLPEKVRIVPAVLGNQAGIIGAAGLVATSNLQEQMPHSRSLT